MKKKYCDILNQYLPSGSVDYVADLIIEHQTHFKISKPRKTKLGDYRAPRQGYSHRISVNGDLNTYSFLITTIHEFAHLTTYNKHKHNVSPHGIEWKMEFISLFNPLFTLVELPEDVYLALQKYFKNPKASSCTDESLLRVLKRYDSKKEVLLLEHIKKGQKFKLNSKIFVKGDKLRKYYLCKAVSSSKKYRVNGLAEIQLIE